MRGEGDSFFDYDDGHVQAVVQAHQDNGRGLAIYQWSSPDSGKGHSTKALEWLRERYEFISVHGIGESTEDPSARFWIEQGNKGLVDQLFFDDGTPGLAIEGKTTNRPKLG